MASQKLTPTVRRSITIKLGILTATVTGQHDAHIVYIVFVHES